MASQQQSFISRESMDVKTKDSKWKIQQQNKQFSFSIEHLLQ